MSDPRYRDPRLDPPPLREDEARSQRMGELESSNAMWGWVAGAVVLALVLVFVFTRSPSDSSSPGSRRSSSRPFRFRSRGSAGHGLSFEPRPLSVPEQADRGLATA